MGHWRRIGFGQNKKRAMCLLIQRSVIFGSVATDSSSSWLNATFFNSSYVFKYVIIYPSVDFMLSYKSEFCCLCLKTVVVCSDNLLTD